MSISLDSLSPEDLEVLLALGYDAKSPGSGDEGDTTAAAGTAAMAVNPWVGTGLKVAGLGMQVLGANAADKQARKDRSKEQQRYDYQLDRNRVAGFLGMRQNRMQERAAANNRNSATVTDLLSQYNRTHGGV